MAIKGKVKDIKITTGKIMGTVRDITTKIDYPFEQIIDEHLGLKVDSLVQFITVNVDGKPVAKDLKLDNN